MKQTIYLNSSINDFIFENSDDGRFNIVGHCCHWNKANLNKEVVLPTSFDTTLTMIDEGKLIPILNWNHSSDQIIGSVDRLTKDNEGLLLEGHLNTGVKYVSEYLVPNIIAGTISGLSTEGTVMDCNDIVNNTDGTYTVKNFILTAIALTPYPADYNAKFTIANAWKELNPTKAPKWYLL